VSEHRNIRRWAVSDGQVALGTVVLGDDGKYRALSTAGDVVGEFVSLQKASRAFELADEKRIREQ
jgi:hypothetical protein